MFFTLSSAYGSMSSTSSNRSGPRRYVDFMSSELQQQLQKLSNSPDERISILSTLLSQRFCQLDSRSLLFLFLDRKSNRNFKSRRSDDMSRSGRTAGPHLASCCIFIGNTLLFIWCREVTHKHISLCRTSF